MNENLPEPSGADSAGELAVIETTIREAPHEYWRDQSMQTRFRDLLAAREGVARGDAAPSPSATATEIAKIERAMRKDWNAYSRNETMQARYRALIAAQHNGVTVGDTAAAKPSENWRSAPDVARKGLAPELVRDWDSAGEFDGRLRATQDAIHEIVLGIGDQALARDMVADFDILPVGTQSAVFNELSRPTWGVIASASSGDVEKFASTDEGRALVREWGSRAGRNVAIVRARLDRMIGAIPAGERRSFSRWFDRISAAEAKAVYRFFVGGSR